jgi:multidrug efflux pump subunit AcrB
MVLGIGIIYVGTLLFVPELNPSALLFPFSVIVLGAVLVYAGFSSSPIEKNVRLGAEYFIKWIRDIIFKDIVNFTLSDKHLPKLSILSLRRFSFFIPLIFTVSTLGLLISGKIGATFFPSIPPDFFNIEVAYTPGDTKEKTDEFLQFASNILIEENQKIAEEYGDTLLNYFTTNLGVTMNLGQFGSHTGMLNVYFDSEGSSTPVDTLINRIIRRVNATAKGKLAKEFFVGGFNRFGADIEFGLSSENNKELGLAKQMFRDELLKMNGVQNVKDNSPEGRSELYVELLPQADIYGIGQAEVVNQIRNGFFGREAQRLIIGTDEVKVWIRYPTEDRNSMEDLKKMKLKTANGLAIPLSEVAQFSLGRGPESLKRRDGKRQVRVDATSIYPDSVATYNTRISEEIIPKLSQIFPSVEFTKMGQFERSQKTSNSMISLTLIMLVMIIIVISLHFTSVYQTFLIILVIPAGIAGAILGHGIVGIPVSTLSAFGMIALLGVLVNDAVVFLDKYNQTILEGKNSYQAAYEAAMARFRPILLTTITTVAGLLPLIAEKSMQAQFLIPMATSIAFGVLFGTLFLLAFFPSAILFGNDIKRFASYVWKGKKPSHQDVETALKTQKEIKEKEL